MRNQVLHFLFKTAGDLVLVSSYEVADILFFESFAIYEAISYYGAQAFTLHSLRVSLPLVTCSSPHRTSKEEDILHPPGHFLILLGADIGLQFKAAIYQLLGCSSHGSNSQALFLSYQLISVALRGSSFHLVVVYISDLVEHFLLLPKRKIPPKIIIYFG